MIEGLNPYAEYKESGLPWLGRCPKNWSVRRAKILFHERVQKGFPNEPLLAATQTKGVVKKEDYETRTVTAQKDLHLLKLVEVGDYVISLRSFQGGIEVAHCRGIISPAYTVLKPQKTATSGYYSHFFKAKPFIDSLSLFVTGIREGQNIDYERLSRAELPLPSEDEQVAIVRFLDHANRKIDGFIRAKRKLIGLLNEQKQAIIHRAVTRGLHPDVPLKPSGIPWLGDIPKHWEVKRLRHACEMRVSNVDKHTKQGETPVRLCNYVEVYKYERISETTRFMAATANQDERVRFRLRMGDVLITKDSEVWNDIGVPALVEYEAPDLVCGYHLAILRPRPGLLGSFLHRALDSRFIATQFHVEANGVTRYGLSQGAILGVSIPIPPPIEQQNIVDYLDAQLATLNTAIARTEREIALMQEYRTRLTADLVTGKLDVRAAAARLPEEKSDESEMSDLSEEPEEPILEEQP